MRKTFPWYDSGWLSDYLSAKSFIKENHPQKLETFIEALAPFYTRKDFEIIKLSNFLSPEILEESKALIKKLEVEKQEAHEFMRFGRIVVHNHEYFNQIHSSITEAISEFVGEELEASYNFLSLYNNLGICKVHMDSPEAKYTVDLCIEQSTDWKIFISQRKDWIEDFEENGQNWQSQIKNDPDNHFKPYSITPGSGIVFSGSSQWHYRDRIFEPDQVHFCHLIFFHFFPKGMKKFINPNNWAKIFEIPELENLKYKSIF